MKTIFHVTSANEWADAEQTGTYLPRGFETEGFIHCAHGDQVQGVLDRYFTGQNSLVALEIDPARLEYRLVDENLLGGGELFPHLYGPLTLSAVVAVHPLADEENRSFTLR